MDSGSSQRYVRNDKPSFPAKNVNLGFRITAIKKIEGPMKTLLEFLLLCVSLLTAPLIAHAWDNENVHPILSEAAVYNSVINENKLNEVLKIENGT